jgi:hypothetical protein
VAKQRSVVDYVLAAIALTLVSTLCAWCLSFFDQMQRAHEATISAASTACAPVHSSECLSLRIQIADLRAQQEMAEWAYLMVASTIAGTIVTTFGLIYVVRAFRLNAAATEHAATAASAAAAANTLSIELNRAHVAILNAEIFVESGMPGSVAILVRNVGKTIAKSVDIRDHVFFGAPNSEFMPTAFDFESVLDMAPDQETTKHIHSFDLASREEAARELATGAKGAFFVVGRVDYVDVVGRSQWTTFRFRAMPDAHGIFREGPMALCEAGNAAS